MEFYQFIDFAKVAYHLYLSGTLEEAEVIEYLWDADAEVMFYSEDELVVAYWDEGLISTITISSNLEVTVETNLDNQ